MCSLMYGTPLFHSVLTCAVCLVPLLALSSLLLRATCHALKFGMARSEATPYLLCSVPSVIRVSYQPDTRFTLECLNTEDHLESVIGEVSETKEL